MTLHVDDGEGLKSADHAGCNFGAYASTPMSRGECSCPMVLQVSQGTTNSPQPNWMCDAENILLAMSFATVPLGPHSCM